MKKLSLLTVLLLSSSVVCAKWKHYEFDSAKEFYKERPTGFCLEADCPNGCAENVAEGKGECCPEPIDGENCKSAEFNDKGCLIKRKKTCPSNHSCQPDGSCVYNMCPEGKTAINGKCCLTPNVYTDLDGNQQCCDKATVTLPDGTKACQSDTETCNPLQISTQYIQTTPEIENKIGDNKNYTTEEFGIYKIQYSGTITPKKDLDLSFDIYGIIDTSLTVWDTNYVQQKILIKEVGGDTIVDLNGFDDFKKQNDFKYKTGGNTYSTELHMYSTNKKLKKGKTYRIEIDIRNVCETCIIDTECAI